MNIRVQITYNVNEKRTECVQEIDPLLFSKMKDIGADFYVSGFDMETGERDIVFDLPIEIPKSTK